MKELEVEVHIGYGGYGYDNRDDYYRDTILVPNAFKKWNKEKQLAWLEKNQPKLEDEIKSYITVTIYPEEIVEDFENE